MKILVLASSSFAAQTLPVKLRCSGHEVWTFNRRPIPGASKYDLSGAYTDLANVASRAMSSCDVVINYSIAKNDGIESNIDLADLILDAARQLKAKRFIHISSISVLPSITGVVDESAEPADARWKGIYSRVKVAVERHIVANWTHADLDIVRPGFILAPGAIDTMVGIGKALPTGHVLGLGSRNTVIMLVNRDAVDQALSRICEIELAPEPKRSTYMLVAPNAPTRETYLRFQCSELGRGWSAIHLPGWVWHWGLALASLPVSLLKRRWVRLAKLFQHNINVRSYDCSKSATALGVELSFPWQQTLRNICGIRESPQWPAPSIPIAQCKHLGYVGMGRIVTQKHFPGLERINYQGPLSWSDPYVSLPPASKRIQPQRCDKLPNSITHAVIATPVDSRPAIIGELPKSVEYVLLEKPLARTPAELDLMRTALVGKSAFVLHNYRFKTNVLQLRDHLKHFPSGALRAVELHLETPSPANEKSTWFRDEWKNRIVVTDYALHYLDICWALCVGPMEIDQCATSKNPRNELESLQASLSFGDTQCRILIRSGGHQRHCIVRHHFQNYSTELRFYPDVFVAYSGGRTMITDGTLASRGMSATAGKILEKLGLWTSDRSHDRVLAAFLGRSEHDNISELNIAETQEFYDRLTKFADSAYAE